MTARVEGHSHFVGLTVAEREYAVKRGVEVESLCGRTFVATETHPKAQKCELCLIALNADPWLA